MLVLVTDGNGDPVPGATVWVPADPALRTQGLAEEGLALVDSQGNSCADPPALALFSACTDAEGIAVLTCGNDAIYLVNYFKDGASGATNGKCAQSGVVPAPLDP
jgi:hypothetical protein